MQRELRFTLRLSDHIGQLTLQHFEFRRPHTSFELEQAADFGAYRAYYKELFIDQPVYDQLTRHQKYLHDLQSLIGPIISSYRIKTRLPRLKPRTRVIAASSRLEQAAQLLAFEAYHFKERLKLFGRSTEELISNPIRKFAFQKEVGKIISNFKFANTRLFRYRNFVVHGPLNRFDEFANLRTWELGGLIHHPDLWYDYNTAFYAVQEDWVRLAKTLISSMEGSVFGIQTINENLIRDISLDFVPDKDVCELT
jgi:hypothetical protein